MILYPAYGVVCFVDYLLSLMYKTKKNEIMEKRKREHYHLIEIRYLPPTNHRDSRVSLHSHRFDDRLTIPYDHYYTNIWEMAEIHLIKKGFEIVGFCETKKGYGLLTTTFKPLKYERKEN